MRVKLLKHNGFQKFKNVTTKKVGTIFLCFCDFHQFSQLSES